jgi:hypothetical protein
MISAPVVAQIARLVAKFGDVMAALAIPADAPTADDRHGAILIKLEEDMIRLAQAARLDLAALDAALDASPVDRRH